MNGTRRFRLLPIAFLIHTAFATTGLTQTAESEADVLAAVERLGQAYRAADMQTLGGLLTDDYVHTNGGSGSRLNRDQWLSWVGSQRELLDSGELRIDTYEVSDTRVELYGNVAVVTGIVRSSGVRNNEPFGVHVRFTNVWVKRDGVWRRAAFHDSPMPEAAANR
jgi:ketosteroid isomerase-like protein